MDKHLYKISGDGMFFNDFYVVGDRLRDALAKASDILAGSDNKEVAKARRFYDTVETHIMSIERVVKDWPNAI